MRNPLVSPATCRPAPQALRNFASATRAGPRPWPTVFGSGAFSASFARPVPRFSPAPRRRCARRQRRASPCRPCGRYPQPGALRPTRRRAACRGATATIGAKRRLIIELSGLGFDNRSGNGADRRGQEFIIYNNINLMHRIMSVEELSTLKAGETKPRRLADSSRSRMAAARSEGFRASVSVCHDMSRQSSPCAQSRGPSDHSTMARCSASVMPEVTKSCGAPASSMVAMAPKRSA